MLKFATHKNTRFILGNGQGSKFNTVVPTLTERFLGAAIVQQAHFHFVYTFTNITVTRNKTTYTIYLNYTDDCC